jgi:hypothetical protein
VKRPVAVPALVLVFVATAVVVPGALNRFVFGKLAVVVIGAGAAALYAPAGRLRREVRVVVGLAAGVLVAAALVSDQPLAGALGRAPRFEGVFVLAAYLAAAWAGARLLGPERVIGAALLAVRVLAVAALLIAFFAVLESAGLRPLTTNVSRPGSMLGNASDEGAVGVLCLGPLALFAVRRRDRLVAAGTVAAVAMTVLSASRGALAAMVIEFLLLGFVLRGRRAVAAGLAAVVALAGLSFVVPATRDRVLGTSPLARHTVSGRELLWRETLSLDASHLALGVGPSNYKSAIVAKHNREWQSKVGPQDPPDSPHSLPLQALSDGGLPLLLLFAVLCGQMVVVGGRRAWRGRAEAVPLEAGAMIGLVGYGIASLVGLTSPGPTLLASAFLGIVMSERPQERRTSIATRAIGAVCFALGLVFLMAEIAEIPLRHAIVHVSRGEVASADHDFAVAHVLRPWDLDLPDVAAHALVTYGIATGDGAAVGRAAVWLDKVPSELREDEQVMLDRASLDEALGNYIAAERGLTAVLGRDRDNPAVLLQRGIVEAEGGSSASAERDFRAAANVVPDDPGPWADLAVLYQQEGRSSDAAVAKARAEALSRRS